MNVWRINLKPSSANGIDPRIFCIQNNVVGIGWGVDSSETLDWDTYKKLGKVKYYNRGDKGWSPAINAIRNRIKNNDLIWTRDLCFLVPLIDKLTILTRQIDIWKTLKIKLITSEIIKLFKNKAYESYENQL